MAKKLVKEVSLKKYTIKKDLIFLLSFFLFSFILEVSLFLFLGFGFFPKYILFNASYLIFSMLVIFAIPNFKVKKWFILILLTIHVVLCITNTTLYALNGDLFYFEMLASVGAEAALTIEYSVLDWVAIAVFVIFLVVIYIFYILFDKKYKVENIHLNKRTSLFLITLMMFSLVLSTGVNRLGYYTINITSGSELEEEDDFSDYKLYNDLQFKVSAYKKFGTFGFYIKNLANIISIESPAERSSNIKDTINYLTNSEYATIINSGEYFGVSKGNNVISVLLESFDSFGVDPYTTPTLYSLLSNNNRVAQTVNENALVFEDGVNKLIKENTIYLSEFYGRNRTNQSETISILGSFAKETQFSRNQKPTDIDKYYNLDFSLPKMINADREGLLKSIYMHGNDSTFYGRGSYLESFGFNEMYFLDTVDEIGGANPSNFYDFIVEENFIKVQKDNIIPVLNDGETFYTQYSTITTHGSYMQKRDRLAKLGYYDIIDQNWDKIVDYLEICYENYYYLDNIDKEILINYKAEMIDLDRAIYELFKSLQEKALHEKTTVVLYSDHYCFYNGLGLNIRGYESNQFEVSPIYNIPCMIFDVSLANKLKDDGKSLENNEFSSVYSIVPTTLDLLGIEYNSAYYLGYSIFNEYANKAGFVSIINGILDNNFFSFDANEIIYSSPNATDDDLKRYKENALLFLTKQKYIEYLYKYNVNKYIDMETWKPN